MLLVLIVDLSCLLLAQGSYNFWAHRLMTSVLEALPRMHHLAALMQQSVARVQGHSLLIYRAMRIRIPCASFQIHRITLQDAKVQATRVMAVPHKSSAC